MSPSLARTTLSDAAKLFVGSRLTLARHLAGLRKNELADRINKTPTAIAAYESGRTRPSAATVAALCIALGVEVSFFLPAPGTASSAAGSLAPHFRSLRSTTQVTRDQAAAYGSLVHEVVSVFDRHVEMPDIDMLSEKLPVHDVASATRPAEVARSLRRSWGLGDEPIRHVLRLAENHGIVCVFSPFEVATVDAYSFETRARPVIVLNPLKGDYYRQRFDLAHEIGHLVMHADAEPGSHTAELEAHRFAAELLLPSNSIMSELPHRPFWPLLQQLKEHWGVSIQALLYRARELGIYSDTTYRNAMARMSKQGWRRQEPGARPTVEQPSLLPRALALLEGTEVSAVELAAEARVPITIFRIVTARSIESIAASEQFPPNAEPAEQPPDHGLQSLLLEV
jgi:Zn-dependent peptidase ImmA (M78 family)/transcriptional regulator with XRE-family HTH domain